MTVTQRFGAEGRVNFAPEFPFYTESVVLVADTLQRVAIPAGAKFAVFSFVGDFYIKLGVVGTTFTLPAASTSDGSGPELNPSARTIPKVLGDGSTLPTHICFRSTAANAGSVAFYA